MEGTQKTQKKKKKKKKKKKRKYTFSMYSIYSIISKPKKVISGAIIILLFAKRFFCCDRCRGVVGEKRGVVGGEGGCGGRRRGCCCGWKVGRE